MKQSQCRSRMSSLRQHAHLRLRNHPKSCFPSWLFFPIFTESVTIHVSVDYEFALAQKILMHHVLRSVMRLRMCGSKWSPCISNHSFSTPSSTVVVCSGRHVGFAMYRQTHFDRSITKVIFLILSITRKIQAIVVDWIISVLQDTRFFSRERYWMSNKAKHNYQVHSQYYVYQFISSFNQSVKFNKFIIQKSYPYTWSTVIYRQVGVYHWNPIG